MTYTYDIPHNHNFDLLTVGYYGSGYETEIYELNDEKVVGYPGEDVELAFLERTKLPKGKAMFYRSFKDVHVQLPPTELSVSLNLLFRDEKINGRDQYSFNVEKKKIIGSLSGGKSDQQVMFEFARLLGDANTGEVALQVAQAHGDPQIRLAAYTCAASLLDKETVWKSALHDTFNSVRVVAKENLAACT